MRVPYYVLFDRLTNHLQIFELTGIAYRELSQERLWIESVGIGLGIWFGTFAEKERQWLRWYDAKGNWILIAEEREQQEREGRRQERDARIQAERRAEQLAERLRALGLDPDNL